MTMKWATRSSHPLFKKTSLVLVILFVIWLISDGDLDVFKALRNHEPSARIFRSLLQVNLVLFGAAFSLYIWSKYIPTSITAEILFAPVFPDSSTSLDDASDPSSPRYYSTVEEEDDEAEYEGRDSSDSTTSHDDAPIHEDMAMDAAYASDGEVSEKSSKLKEHNDDESSLPTASFVANMALDLLLKILVTLFFFTISSFSAQSTPVWRVISQVAAPTFPLLLFLYLCYQLFFPWKRRKDLILVLYTTLAAPYYPVTFRDGFIGDILTSTVRPLQDISFTILYILFGLHSWYSANYFLWYQQDNDDDDDASFIDHADASVPAIERSWILHTIAMPMCMVSPLWYRFLQNLRQAHDNRRRWPYLGNALKYFVAAQVAMFGVFQPAHKKSFLWLASFVGATLYQIWWDVFMDWSLLEQREGSLRLREKRLYTKKWVYWSIFGINFVLRFCWTLSFLPLRYLNAAGVLTNNFKGDLTAFFGPTIASAEIIRRALWGLLRVEWEAIQVRRSMTPGGMSNVVPKGDERDNEKDDEGTFEMIPMNMQGMGDTTIPLSSRAYPSLVDMSSMDSIQVYLELGLYAACFCAIGLVAAAHRGTF